jgi:hypothetical protein
VSKYDPLRDYLAARSDALPQLTLTFTDVEALVGPLPEPARTGSSWWANDGRSEHAWNEAGWRVLAVDHDAERVVFARGAVGGRRGPVSLPANGNANGNANAAPRYGSVPAAQSRGGGLPSGGPRPARPVPPARPAASGRPADPDGQSPRLGRWSAEARLGLEPWAAPQARPVRSTAALEPDPAEAPPPWDGLPPVPGSASQPGPPNSDPADMVFGVTEGQRTRRARRLAAHLDASLRAATARLKDEEDALKPVLDPSPDRGPRTPHAGTHPGGYTSPLDPGVPETLIEAMLEAYLLSEGWTVQPTAGETSEFGPSLVATRHNRTLAVAVRGYPAASPLPVGEGPPAVQARHWYAQAILEAILIRGAQPDVDIAIGLPDVPVYRGLHGRSRDVFGRLNLLVFFVAGDGRVRDH